MKKMKFMLCAITVIAAASCAKEIAPENNQEGTAPELDLIPMTFTAGAEEAGTKVALQSDGKTLHWESTDQIKVFDGASNDLPAFTTTGSGASADFTGGVTDENAETYYALYPYQEEATFGKDAEWNSTTTKDIIFAEVPAVQTASAGNLPKNAFIAVAKSDSKDYFKFMSVCGYVKFTLNDENAADIQSITLSGNNNESLAGKIKVAFKDDGTPENAYVSGGKSTIVTLEGTFENGKDYYFAVRSTSFAKGITLSALYKDGSRKYIASSSAPGQTLGRNQVMNIGSPVMKAGTPNDLYVAYEHGFDINVGGMKFDRQTYGKATLITEKISGPSSGVYFLNPDIEQPIGSNITALAIIGRYRNQKSILTRNGHAYIKGTENDDFLILSNVEYKVSDLTQSYFMAVNGTEAFENLIYDNVKIEVPNTKAIAYCANDNNRAFKSIVLVNSDIKVGASAETDSYTSGNATYLFKSVAATTDQVDKDMESIVIENNVIYSDGDVKRFRIVSAESAGTNVLKMNNNTIINCYTNAGYVAFSTVANTVDVNRNLFHIPNHENVKKWYAIVYPKTYPDPVTNEYIAIATDQFSDNHTYYGGETLSTFYLRSLYATSENSPATLNTTPFTEESITAGNFSLPEGTTYGATR